MKNEYMRFDEYKKADKKDDGFGFCVFLGVVGAVTGYLIGFNRGFDTGYVDGTNDAIVKANNLLDQIAAKASVMAADAFCKAIETTTPSVVGHLNALIANEETAAAFEECVCSTFWDNWKDANWHIVLKDAN